MQQIKKNARLLIVLLAVAIAVGATALVNHSHQKVAFKPRQACGILTLAIAHRLNGAAAQQPVRDSVTDDTRTTYCVYRGDSTSIALVVRAARTAHGVALNKSAFTAPVGSVAKVVGYGDAAYWSPTFAQLNILKHNTWYILSNGSNVPSQRTLSDAKNLADLVVPDL